MTEPSAKLIIFVLVMHPMTHFMQAEIATGGAEWETRQTHNYIVAADDHGLLGDREWPLTMCAQGKNERECLGSIVDAHLIGAVKCFLLGDMTHVVHSLVCRLLTRAACVVHFYFRKFTQFPFKLFLLLCDPDPPAI